MRYYDLLADSPVSQPYYLGFVMISISFRFFFSLKATKVFGPFTKLIKINALSLMPWVFLTALLLLFSSNSLYVLLSEQPSTCSSVYSCLKVLIEAGVGAVRFGKLGSEWVGFLFFGGITLVVAAVLMNMVIAKINSSYNEVSRRGTLYYYKDLLDLRYLYFPDPQYSFLVAIEHPFAMYLMPSIFLVAFNLMLTIALSDSLNQAHDLAANFIDTFASFLARDGTTANLRQI